MATDHDQTRKDTATAEIIEAGIRMQDAIGARAAAAYLTGSGVAFSVVVRVLAGPNGRRDLWRGRSAAEGS